jgi:hypothetical protein
MGLLFVLAGLVLGISVAPFFRRRETVPAATLDEKGNWCFPVDTFEQMLAIPVERRARFLAEFPLVLTRIWEMQDRYPLATLPGSVWVDDGLGELRPNIVNAPAETGEAFAKRSLDPASAQ